MDFLRPDSLVHANLVVQINYCTMHCKCNSHYLGLNNASAVYVAGDPRPSTCLGHTNEHKRHAKDKKKNCQVKIHSTVTSTVTECELNQLVSVSLSNRECTKLPIFV